MPDPDSYDPLSALAPLFRVRPELQSFCRFGAQWASPHDHEQAGWAPFHMVTAGRCVLDVEGASAITIVAGDIVVLPQGDAHVVRGAATPKGAPRVEVTIVGTYPIEIRCNTDRPEAELICGRLAFEQPHDNLARAALPRLIHVSTEEEKTAARLRALLLAIREEIESAEPGARAICCDLASALLVMVLRVHVRRHPHQQGMLNLLRQRQTARALTAMMADPARAWTLDEIAAQARTSRATLVRDFRRLAMASPFDVLAELRLGIARHALRATDRPLSAIAADAGYQSASAFSRAFQRHFSTAPGQIRKASAG